MIAMSGTALLLTGRDRALLRAVAAGRCELAMSCEPVLLVDGLPCSDSSVAHRLIAAGYVAAPDPTRLTAPALLTPSGLEALAPAS
jgi:hypothetical protein